MAKDEWINEKKLAIEYWEEAKRQHPEDAKAYNEKIEQLEREIRQAEEVASETPKPEEITEPVVDVKEPKGKNSREKEVQEAAAEEDLETAKLKRKEVELSVEEKEEAKEDRRRRRKKEEEEEREREKWGRAKWVWGKTKKTAKVAHGVVSLGSGWIGFFLFSALIIWFLDFSYKYIGVLEFSFVPSDLLNWGVWGAFFILMVYHITKNWGTFDLGEWISYAVAILTLIFVAFTGTLNRLGLIHLIFIIVFWWVIINDPEKNKVTSNILLSAIIIADFYRYVILKAFLPMTLVTEIMRIPFLLIGTIIGLRGRFPEKLLPKVAFFGLFLVIFSLNVGSIVLASKAMIGTEAGVAVMGPWEVIKGTLVGFKGFFADIKKGYEAQMEYATGGYYKGQVEENEKEQLGVYLENVEAADTTFLREEEVTIWGDLKARTLDEPIYVRMSCESVDANRKVVIKGKIIPESLGSTEGGYEIQKLEEIGFECRFSPEKLNNGSNEIKIKAEFNFKTLAFLKTYFMDIERIRALRRENIDPLEQYGIIDKTPTAVYTNGPVKLGMGTIDPPLGLNYQNVTSSFIGMTVEGQWVGRIKNITGLEFQVPSVLKVEGGPEFFCKGGFKKIGENEEGYAIYKMTEDAIKRIKTPIEQFRSWRCSLIVPKANEVLGKTPVTTYYYRANVEYVYEIEQSISVYVQPPLKEEKTKLFNCVEACTNSAGCICAISGCKLKENTEIGLNNHCNSTGTG